MAVRTRFPVQLPDQIVATIAHLILLMAYSGGSTKGPREVQIVTTESLLYLLPKSTILDSSTSKAINKLRSFYLETIV